MTLTVHALAALHGQFCRDRMLLFMCRRFSEEHMDLEYLMRNGATLLSGTHADIQQVFVQ